MIVTVSRQFASGGRELGKRLADELGLAYYDRELITQIASSASLTEDYVSKILENGGINNYVFSFAHSMPLAASMTQSVTDVLVAQQKVIKAIAAKGDCVIVGRCADVLAREYKPVRLFVYADDASKIARCREREREGEELTDKKLLKRFKEIDKGREKIHDLLASTSWGEKSGYELMINTSDMRIKDIVKPLSEFIKAMSRGKV